MAMRYAIPPGARLKVLTVSGKVHVVAEDRADVEIEPGERRIENSDDGHVMETHSKSTNLRDPRPHRHERLRRHHFRQRRA